MKAIFVLFDSLNRHYLPPYGNEWVQAPNFSRLAERTTTFDNCYVGSMPCMPARRELHTGRYNFLHRSWGPLEPFDESMPEILSKSGVYTHLVSDHSHYWEDGGATYHTRYNSWEIIRGQEGDPWKGRVAEPQIPQSPRKTRNKLWRQDWVNRSYLQKEEEMPLTLTFERGLEFIETNHQEDKWFLQLETFDPHEPFHSLEEYKNLYPHDYKGPHFDWPDYGPVTEEDETVEHMRREYAALLSMCDRYLGKVLDKMDELNLWQDTMLIVSTDHGYSLGEHNYWAKNMQPWYNELAHTPLFIWDPRSQHAGERRDSLVQWIDLPPTLLDFFGVSIPESMQGASLRETVESGAPVREAALFGMHGGHVNVTDARYVYMRAPATAENGPLFEYTLMPTHMSWRFGIKELQNMELAEPFKFTQGVRTLKIPTVSWFRSYDFGSLLFDLAQDPGQDNPLQRPEIEQQMVKQLVKLMRWNEAPPEQYERLGLNAETGQAEETDLAKVNSEAKV